MKNQGSEEESRIINMLMLKIPGQTQNRAEKRTRGYEWMPGG